MAHCRLVADGAYQRRRALGHVWLPTSVQVTAPPPAAVQMNRRPAVVFTSSEPTTASAAQVPPAPLVGSAVCSNGRPGRGWRGWSWRACSLGSWRHLPVQVGRLSVRRPGVRVLAGGQPVRSRGVEVERGGGLLGQLHKCGLRVVGHSGDGLAGRDRSQVAQERPVGQGGAQQHLAVPDPGSRIGPWAKLG